LPNRFKISLPVSDVISLIQRAPLLSYFVLAYALTWMIEVPMMLSVRGVIAVDIPHALEALAAFGPFAAALLVLSATTGRTGALKLVRSFIDWRVHPGWLLVTVLSPFLVLVAALVITGELGKLISGELSRHLVSAGKMFELVVLGGVLRGIGEEPGWRGYALPVLRGRFGPLVATLALFPAWWLWHLPSFLMRPEFQPLQFLMFGAGILAAAVWCTQLYDATRSVFVIALWHALINICRGYAGAASMQAFLAFAQIVLLVAAVIVVYWLLRRPGRYADTPLSHSLPG
jgi:membrane protease YdiL (CAAX protease family)